jgi:putative FmdB family regulatory protein
MPIYEYLCEGCGKVNEKLQKVNDKPPSQCDECGGRKLAKLVSRSAFQLKGGGWYSDLYATPKDKGAAGKDGKDGKDAPAATAEAKPAATADAKPAAEAEAAPAASPATEKKGKEKKTG